MVRLIGMQPNICIVKRDRLTLDQEGHRAGPLAEASDDCKAPWQEIALLRTRWILNKFVLRGGQLLFDFVQITQKVHDCVDTTGNFWMGAVLDEELQFFIRAIEHRTDLQPSGFTQLVAQLQALGGGGSPEKR